MADSVGQIGLDLVVNKNGFDKQMKGIGTLAKKAGAALAAAFAVKKLVDFGKSAIDLGSDLAEVQNVVDVTFSSMSSKVDEFARNAATSFGLSETMAKRYTGTFGAMAKAFGFNEKAAYDMSTTLTGLAGDVASFYNISQDESYTKLKSVFTGETESLKDLGVVMTQTALDQFAMANGFGKTTAKMSEAEKVALRYAFVQKQLATANGDFSRTSDGWANQVRILTLQFESFKATIGQGLINLFTPVIKTVNILIGKLQSLANGFKTFTEVITGNKASDQTSAAISSIGANATDAASNISGMGDAAADSAKKAQKALTGFDQVNVLADNSEYSSGNTSGGSANNGLSDIVNGGTILGNVEVNPGIEKAINGIKSAIQPTIDALGGLKDALQPLKDFVAQGVKDFYDKFLVPVGIWVFGDGIPKLTTALGNLFKNVNWTKLNDSLSKLFDSLAPFAITIGSGLLDFIGNVSNVLKPIIADTMEVFADALSLLGDAISSISPSTTTNLSIALGSLFASLALSASLSSVAGILSKLGFGLKDLGTGISTLGSLNPTTISIFFGGLVGDLDEWVSGKLEEKLGPVWKKIIIVFGNAGFGAIAGGMFGGPIGAVAGALITGLIAAVHDADWSAVWKAVKDGLKDWVDAVFNWSDTKALFDNMIQHFKDALNGRNILEIGENIVKGLFNGIASAFTFLLEPIKDLFEKIITDIKKLFGIHSPSKVFYEIGEFLVLGLQNGVDSIVNKVVDTFKKLWEDIKKVFTNAGTWFKTKFEEAYRNITGAFTNVKTWATERYNDIKSVFGDVSSWFKDKFTSAWVGLKKSFTENNVLSWFTEKREDIKDTFKSIPQWFETTFSKAWTAVKNVFSTGGKIFDGIKDGIADTFKLVVNKLISGINTIIAAPFKKINDMLNTIRSVSVLGVKPFSGLWDQNPLSVPKIPALAQGGYVKANTPQLAMIGDNKHEGEVVAPESKLVQMALEAARLAGGSGGLTEAALYRVMSKVFQEYMHIYIGEEDLARHVNRGNEMIDLRSNPVKGRAR